MGGANLKSAAQNCQLRWYCAAALAFVTLISIRGCSGINIYQVGDLDAWGIPTSSNPRVYSSWAKFHSLKIGDSLFFLYPPSQDSVIQVTEESYNTCNLKDPILYLNNGNSLFNVTEQGDLYFTSGVEGHCQKSQKLHISVFGNGSASAVSPAAAASAPSYPTVFGSIPIQASASPPPPPKMPPISMMSAAAAAFFVTLFGL